MEVLTLNAKVERITLDLVSVYAGRSAGVAPSAALCNVPDDEVPRGDESAVRGTALRKLATLVRPGHLRDPRHRHDDAFHVNVGALDDVTRVESGAKTKAYVRVDFRWKRVTLRFQCRHWFQNVGLAVERRKIGSEGNVGETYRNCGLCGITRF